MPKKSSQSTESKALLFHKKFHGKIETKSKADITTPQNLALAYTPGVAEVSTLLAKKPALARDYTFKRNSVAVISDGSSVLGLGNIGPYGAYPVMEGKAAIFKTFAGIDAVPILLDTQDPDEIIRTIIAIAPTFGGINLEDIARPHCFAIEKALIEKLSIPVMHDDQHGTAIVVLAGFINASKVVKKDITKMKVVISGAGAAGTATALLLVKYGIKNVIVLDSKGALYKGREGMDVWKEALAQKTNPKQEKGVLSDVAKDADVLIGLSGKGSEGFSSSVVSAMAKGAIVFALANPHPEILPKDAKKAGAIVVATGRSDFPNQINNALVFPGVFRGALDGGVKKITDAMKIRAGEALASLIKKPTPEMIIPSLFDTRVVKTVAKAITYTKN